MLEQGVIYTIAVFWMLAARIDEGLHFIENTLYRLGIEFDWLDTIFLKYCAWSQINYFVFAETFGLEDFMGTEKVDDDD